MFSRYFKLEGLTLKPCHRCHISNQKKPYLQHQRKTSLQTASLKTCFPNKFLKACVHCQNEFVYSRPLHGRPCQECPSFEENVPALFWTIPPHSLRPGRLMLMDPPMVAQPQHAIAINHGTAVDIETAETRNDLWHGSSLTSPKGCPMIVGNCTVTKLRLNYLCGDY